MNRERAFTILLICDIKRPEKILNFEDQKKQGARKVRWQRVIKILLFVKLLGKISNFESRIERERGREKL